MERIILWSQNMLVPKMEISNSGLRETKILIMIKIVNILFVCLIHCLGTASFSCLKTSYGMFFQEKAMLYRREFSWKNKCFFLVPRAGWTRTRMSERQWDSIPVYFSSSGNRRRWSLCSYNKFWNEIMVGKIPPPTLFSSFHRDDDIEAF